MAVSTPRVGTHDFGERELLVSARDVQARAAVLLDSSSSTRDVTSRRQRGKVVRRADGDDYRSLLRLDLPMVNNSFGPIGYVGRVGSNRVKGFLTEVITPERCPWLEGFLRFLEGKEGIACEPETRFLVRFTMTEDAIDRFFRNHRRAAQRYLEALMPLPDGRFVAYFGHNKESRRTTQAAIERARRNVDVAHHVASKPLSFRAMRGIARDNGYSISFLDTEKINGERKQLEVMLPNFNYTESDIRGLLSSPAVRISLVKKGHQAVGMAIAESAVVPLDGGILRIAEITDAYVMSEHRGLNLYTLASNELITSLGGTHVLYGEWNLDQPGVLVSIFRQGWRISMDPDYVRWPTKGMLELASEIEKELRNLAVGTIDRAHIERLAGCRRA